MVPELLKQSRSKKDEFYRKKSGIDTYYSSRYGEDWVKLSKRLRDKLKRCQWCNKKQRHLSDLAGHHIGCVKYNYQHLLDERVIIIVCDSCHKLLEPWSKINLTQMLPQLYE